MRIEFVPKVLAVIADVDILSLKRGQTDVDPAVCVHLKVTQSNHTLHMLDKSLLETLYQKGQSSAKQQVLDGVPVVSEYASLTAMATHVGAIKWDDEQTGATLKIYQGVTGDEDITLRDCTVRKVKISPKEGGAVEYHLQVWTSDVDQDTIGALGVLKSLDREIELIPATPMEQSTIDDGEDDKKLTPADALEAAAKG